MHAPKSGIDVEQLKERIRSQVVINRRRFRRRHTEAGVPRLALDPDKAFSEVFQFHLKGGGHSHLEKLETLREQARKKTDVSRWIPKPFRRWFRKQGDFNKLVLDSLRMIEKTQRTLVKENREARAYLSAHHYWLRDFVERRVEDRRMINALHAASGAHARTSRTIQTQLDRQGEVLQSSGRLANSMQEQLDLHLERAHELNLRIQAIESEAAELRRRLEEETRSRGALFAELTAKLDQESQARGSASTELSMKVESEIAANRALSAELAERHSELLTRLAEVEGRLGAEAQARAALNTGLETANASWTAAVTALQDAFRSFDERQLNDSAYIKGELSLQQQLIHDRRTPGDRTAAKSGKVISNDNALGHRFDAFYLAFENRFRGSKQEIKDRSAWYLPHLAKLRGARNNIRILDVGCGRGEWMELLKENRYSKVSGVDSNVAMASQCHERGLDVVVQDGVAYLSSLKGASLNVITAFHVIEHLQFAHLMQFLTQCRRALKRGGMLILETPNPDNLVVAAKNFYIDPTHLRPLPSALTSFLAAHVGFTDVNTFNQHPFPSQVLVREPGELATRFNEFFYSEQDYAIIARKP